jgi:hypothetical protein
MAGIYTRDGYRDKVGNSRTLGKPTTAGKPVTPAGTPQ